MEIEIPTLPDDLATLTTEQLSELLTELQALADRIYEQDAELVEGMTNDQVIEAMTTVVERIGVIKAEVEARETAAADTQAALAELHAQATAGAETDDEPEPEDETDPDAEPEPDPDADPDADLSTTEPDAEPDGDPEDAPAEANVVAAGNRRFVPRPATRIQVTDRQPNGAALIAAAELPGFSAGQPIDNLMALAHAVMRRHDGLGRGGNREPVVVASARHEFESDRVLDGDEWDTREKILNVIGGPVGTPQQVQALAASGGLCAPSTINYAVPVLGVTDEPVGAALPKFQAARGGIKYTFGPTLADITSGISSVTAAEDAAGYGTGTGETAPKDCLEVACPTFVEVLIDAIATCIKFGNFTARSYPEMVEAWIGLMGIALAQTKEVKRLDAIKAGSTAVSTRAAGPAGSTTVPVLGARVEFVNDFVTLTAAWRSRWRLADGTRFRAVLPRWVPDAIVADDAMRAEYEGRVETREQAIALISRYVDPVFYLDSATSEGQMFGAQSSGAASDYPDTAKWALFPEGTWVEIDGGSLDLGLIRDSTLVASNDYIIFAEDFLNIARVGPQSLWLTTDFAVTGASAALATVSPG